KKPNFVLPWGRTENLLKKKERRASIGLLVLGRQQQRGHGAVRFRDDPEPFCIRDRVAAHQAEPILEAQFVFSFVVLAEIAPITTEMPGEEFQGRLIGLLQ